MEFNEFKSEADSNNIGYKLIDNEHNREIFEKVQERMKQDARKDFAELVQILAGCLDLPFGRAVVGNSLAFVKDAYLKYSEMYYQQMNEKEAH